MGIKRTGEKLGEEISRKTERVMDKLKGDTMVIDNLEALYITELNDLYDAETQIIEAMPMMIDTATNPVLKKELDKHLRQTREQRDRLTEVMQLMGEAPKPKTCQGMKGILKEGEDMMKKETTTSVKDAALMAAAQKVEHYEMASYEIVASYAKLLNDYEAERKLRQTLMEEKDTAKKLSELGAVGLNEKAVEG